MGRPKALLPFRGIPLIQHSIETFAKLNLNPWIVGMDRDAFSDKDYKDRMLPDEMPGMGPLGGIHAALQSSSTEANYFLPCDTPLIPSDLFIHLSQYWSSGDIIAPKDSLGKLHPLCSLISISALEEIQDFLRLGGRSILDFLETTQLRTVYVNAAEKGIPDLCFLNINSPRDYRRLKMKKRSFGMHRRKN